MTTAAPEQRAARWRSRVTVSRGLATITLALLALIAASVSHQNLRRLGSR